MRFSSCGATGIRPSWAGPMSFPAAAWTMPMRIRNLPPASAVSARTDAQAPPPGTGPARSDGPRPLSWPRSGKPSRRRGCSLPATLPGERSICPIRKRPPALPPTASELHEKRITLAELARREGIRFAPDLLIPYSHWITPEIEPRRFDTRFFLAQTPGGAGRRPRPDGTDGIPLDDARSRPGGAQGGPDRPDAAHPQDDRRVAGIFRYRAPLCRRPVAADLYDLSPRPSGRRTASASAFPTIRSTHLTAWKQPPRPGETTRIVMQDGIWKTYSV